MACALAHRLGHANEAVALTRRIQQSPLVSLWSLDSTQANAAIVLGTRLGLRGADAVYAALAEAIGAQHVSLDQEHIRRAGALTPETWMASRL